MKHCTSIWHAQFKKLRNNLNIQICIHKNISYSKCTYINIYHIITPNNFDQFCKIRYETNLIATQKSDIIFYINDLYQDYPDILYVNDLY